MVVCLFGFLFVVLFHFRGRATVIPGWSSTFHVTVDSLALLILLLLPLKCWNYRQPMLHQDSHATVEHIDLDLLNVICILQSILGLKKP